MLHDSDADETRVIAGGQTLVPLMAMRLARPKRLIDIARLGELDAFQAALQSLGVVGDDGDRFLGASSRFLCGHHVCPQRLTL